jgi:anti-sigma factor RsiW
MNQPAITDADLQAYVDDRLPAARRAAVEEFLRQNPDVAERVEAYAAQKSAIQALHRDKLDETIPERLLRAATRGDGDAAPKRAPWFPAFQSGGPAWRIAAGLVIACVGAMAGWAGRGTLASEAPAPQQEGVAASVEASLPRWAAMAHRVYSPDMKRPVELDASEEPLLVKWLSRRLRTPIRPPALSAFGYHLIGGRLLSGPQGPVAQFMYQDAAGQRLTLYVSGEHGADSQGSVQFAREGSVNVYYWFYDNLGYAMSADVDKARLEPLAASACEQTKAG